MSADPRRGSDLQDFLARCGGQMKERGLVIIWNPTNRKLRRPPFAYSVGLCDRFKRPELLLFGFDEDDSLVIINALVRRYVRSGFAVPLDDPIQRVLTRGPLVVKAACLERVRPYARLAVEYCEYLRLACSVQQVVVPDGSGKFPWEEGYDVRLDCFQPRLFDQQ